VSERPDVRFLALSGTGQRHPHWSAMGDKQTPPPIYWSTVLHNLLHGPIRAMGVWKPSLERVFAIGPSPNRQHWRKGSEDKQTGRTISRISLHLPIFPHIAAILSDDRLQKC
jgi:hypothetical protein